MPKDFAIPARRSAGNFFSAAEKIRQIFHNAEISTKITAVYAICFLILLAIINAVMYFGIFKTLYDPAEHTIKYSMEQTKILLANLAQDISAYDPDAIRKPLVAGVVLRVVKDSGEMPINTDENYLSLKDFEENILKPAPIFADNDMDVAEINGALVYRAQMEDTFFGEHCTFYFFRTITSQKFLLEDLERILLALDVFGIIFAVIIGKSMSRRILKPIKTMTQHAQNIAYGQMDDRIAIPPANDELTALAKTFNDMLDRIQGGIDAQKKFVLDASHELINPATAILNGVNYLKRYGSKDKDSFNENVDIIFSEIQSIGDILQNMLFLARTDHNRQPLIKTNLEMADLVEYAVDMTRVATQNHRVELLENDEATIFGDENTIRQMLLIFLDNAAKFTPAGGKIVVNSFLDGKNIRLSIADNGIGIAPENLGKIFDRFFKVANENVDGSGLGLSVAKWIAERHGIKIGVESELGKGSTFTLTIPTI